MDLLKWVSLLLFTQCFEFRKTGFGPSWDIGFILTLDRLVFIITLLFTVWKFIFGKFKLPALGKVGWYTLLFTLLCTASFILVGRIPFSNAITYLFDFNYIPFAIFIIVKGIPHNREKLEYLSMSFLILGIYLILNGVFEYFGVQALVWPNYILDPNVGDQFGRTRGSFINSEGLGSALVVTFLIYLFYITRAEGKRLYGSCLMIGLASAVIYTTNQRSVWLSLGMCLIVLAIAKSNMKGMARCLLCVVLVGFLSGAGTHFSLWTDKTLFSRRQNTIDYRKVNILINIDMGMANPMFGVGYGNWSEEWHKYFRPIKGLDIPDLTDGNHNTFLGRFAELGFVGLILYLMIFYHMFRIGLRVYRNSKGYEREFTLIFLLILISYMIGACLSDYRNSPFLNMSLFLFFGAVAGIEAQITSRTSSNRPAPVDIPYPKMALRR